MSTNHQDANFIFIGPTAYGFHQDLSTHLSGFTILPPVKRGDISKIAQSFPPTVIVIVDGVFHAVPSVGHAEIRDAIQAGWTIWGLSSIGAIRACEMRTFGMHGFGAVYERYVEEDDFQDDEVALLHGPLPPYPAFSEPFIHLRLALKKLQDHGLLTEHKSTEIAAQLKALWYGKRTLPHFRSLVLQFVNADKQSQAEELLSNFDEFRIKNLDLRRFVETKPWKTKSGSLRNIPSE